MVDAQLTRPPQAAIAAAWHRDGNRVHFDVHLTNLSGAILSSTRNDATVHAIVYEDARVADTDRFARAATFAGMTNDLAPGATTTFSLVTSDLVGVNWDKLHFLVLADYRPAGRSGSYDMLQAAVAVPATFQAIPDTYSFLVDPAYPANQSFQVHLSGPDWLTWSASADVSWLDVSPGGGPMAISPTVTLKQEILASGWQEGHVNFTTTGSGPILSDQTLIRAYLGPVARVYLPLVRR